MIADRQASKDLHILHSYSLKLESSIINNGEGPNELLNIWACSQNVDGLLVITETTDGVVLIQDRSIITGKADELTIYRNKEVDRIIRSTFINNKFYYTKKGQWLLYESSSGMDRETAHCEIRLLSSFKRGCCA